jgi:integrase
MAGRLEARAAFRGAAPSKFNDVDLAERRGVVCSFRQAAESYIDSHRADWHSVKSGKAWSRTLATYAYPVIGDLPVAAIDTSHIMRVLEPIWTTKPETGGRVRQRIESILDWAKARGYRDGKNPARWRGHLDKVLPAQSEVHPVEPHAALAYTELPAFIVALRHKEGVAARALEFAILTATGTSECLGARWSEVNLKVKLWTIPAERSRAGKGHRVPLSRGAVAILEALTPTASAREFVFPGAKPGEPLSNTALLMLLRRMKRDDLTANGFRSTFRNWAAERTRFQREVVEMALARAVGDKNEGTQRRGDLVEKRRLLMEAWADYCSAG